jgi:glycosyltransferase involved in cell wall biosynthesis
MLQEITPLVLTRNEAANIGRTLKQLSWAEDIVVVDSFSRDETLNIVSTFPQVRVFQREFDRHDRQWNFALKETGIRTEWVLALDADYVLSEEGMAEFDSLRPTPATNGYRAKFVYCINGKPLRSSLYPPVTVLYRKAHAQYGQHDDRKSFRTWLDNQARYAELEARKLLGSPSKELTFSDRLRAWRIIAPIGVLFYCLIYRGGILDGRAGLYYAFQRLLAEAMLSAKLFAQANREERRAESEGQDHLPFGIGQ